MDFTNSPFFDQAYRLSALHKMTDEELSETLKRYQELKSFYPYYMFEIRDIINDVNDELVDRMLLTPGGEDEL